MTIDEYNSLTVGTRVIVKKSGKIYELTSLGGTPEFRQENALAVRRQCLAYCNEQPDNPMSKAQIPRLEAEIAELIDNPILVSNHGFYQIRNGFRYGPHRVLDPKNIEVVK